MNELIKINFENEIPMVSARDLHDGLEIKTPYTMWIERMVDYGFEEGKDFLTKMLESTGGRPMTDNPISVNMAKELCMIQRSDKGKRYREYFIALEDAWNTPEQVMARALKIADKTITALNGKVTELESQIEEQKPDVEFAQHISKSTDTIDMLEMSKVLSKNGYKIGRTNLFKLLRREEILMLDNQPYQKYIDWFEVVENTYDTGYKVRISFKPLVTIKGQKGILRLLKKEYDAA